MGGGRPTTAAQQSRRRDAVEHSPRSDNPHACCFGTDVPGLLPSVGSRDTAALTHGVCGRGADVPTTGAPLRLRCDDVDDRVAFGRFEVGTDPAVIFDVRQHGRRFWEADLPRSRW